MPIYEYQCAQCGHRFELIRLVSLTDDKITCPSCGDSQVQKLLSPFACGGSRESLASPSSGGCSPKLGRFT